jgi:hypothetical protein
MHEPMWAIDDKMHETMWPIKNKMSETRWLINDPISETRSSINDTVDETNSSISITWVHSLFLLMDHIAFLIVSLIYHPVSFIVSLVDWDYVIHE